MADEPRTLDTVPRSLRERQRAEREELILLEAERLLSTEGYDGLVMERLAEHVGISKGTIYQHFSKKEDLVGAIILRGLERIDAQLSKLIADVERPAAERLALVIRLLVEGGTAWMLAVAGPQKHELAAALADHAGLRTAFERFNDGLQKLIGQGQGRGEFDPVIPASVAARFLLSLVRARGGPALRDNSDMPLEAFAALALRFYFHGLSVNKD